MKKDKLRWTDYCSDTVFVVFCANLIAMPLFLVPNKFIIMFVWVAIFMLSLYVLGSHTRDFYSNSIFSKINFALNVTRYTTNIRVVEVHGRITEKYYKKCPIIGIRRCFITAQISCGSGNEVSLKVLPDTYARVKIGAQALCLRYDYYDDFDELLYSELKSIAKV